MGEQSTVAGMDYVIFMELSHSTKVERTNAGESSRGHDQSEDLTDEEVSTNHAL